MKRSAKFLLPLLVILPFNSFAYVIYNQTSHSVYVEDSHSKGLAKTITAGERANCDSKLKDCTGKIYLDVYAAKDNYCIPSGCYPSKSMCHLKTRLDKKSGYYFLIEENPSKKFSEPGWCTITQHRV